MQNLLIFDKSRLTSCASDVDALIFLNTLRRLSDPSVWKLSSTASCHYGTHNATASVATCKVENYLRDTSSVATCTLVNHLGDTNRVATCNVVNDPRDVSSVATCNVVSKSQGSQQRSNMSRSKRSQRS